MSRITLPLSDDMIAEIDKRLKSNETRVGFIRAALQAELDRRNGGMKEAAE